MPNYIIKLLKGAGAHNTKLICETEASSSLASGSARKSEWKVLRIQSRMRRVLEKGARLIHQHRQLVISNRISIHFSMRSRAPHQIWLFTVWFFGFVYHRQKESSGRRSEWNMERAIETVKWFRSSSFVGYAFAALFFPNSLNAVRCTTEKSHFTTIAIETPDECFPLDYASSFRWHVQHDNRREQLRQLTTTAINSAAIFLWARAIICRGELNAREMSNNFFFSPTSNFHKMHLMYNSIISHKCKCRTRELFCSVAGYSEMEKFLCCIGAKQRRFNVQKVLSFLQASQWEW